MSQVASLVGDRLVLQAWSALWKPKCETRIRIFFGSLLLDVRHNFCFASSFRRPANYYIVQIRIPRRRWRRYGYRVSDRRLAEPASFPLEACLEVGGGRGRGAGREEPENVAFEVRPTFEQELVEFALEFAASTAQRLIFLEETWVSFRRWTTFTFLASLKADGLIAPRVFQGSMTGSAFEDYLRRR